MQRTVVTISPTDPAVKAIKTIFNLGFNSVPVVEKKKIVGFDVVELAPVRGMQHADFTAAKLIYKLLGCVFNGKDK